ncbi:MAG: HEAT repeat domain-containing protein [Candidatus Freyarchaeota archaeon]
MKVLEGKEELRKQMNMKRMGRKAKSREVVDVNRRSDVGKRFYSNRDVALRVVEFLKRNPNAHFYELVVVCYVLGLLGDPVGIPSLVSLLRERRGGNRTKFDQYLARVNQYVKKAAADALIRIGKPAVPQLVELLKSEHTETVKYAAYALGKIGDRKAIPPLLEVVKNHHGLVREAAGRAILQIDPETAVGTFELDIPSPSQHSLPSVSTAELDLKTIKKHYSSIDDLGPPSEYRFSAILYETIKEDIAEYDEELESTAGNPEPLIEGPPGGILRELNIPQEIISKLAEYHYHQILCMCGEYLKVRYVDRLSNRVYLYEDSEEGRVTIMRNVMCVYCENCKRYTGVEKSVEMGLRPPKHPNFFLFYLPRLPKQTELLTWKELKSKPPKLIRETLENERS